MLRAIETALAGYAERSRDIARVGDRIARRDGDDVGNTVELIANQHAAEANLVVARVADEAEQALIHVIA